VSRRETAILALLLVVALASMGAFFSGYLLSGLLGVMVSLVLFLFLVGSS
jgi:hypothetical protein